MSTEKSNDESDVGSNVDTQYQKDNPKKKGINVNGECRQKNPNCGKTLDMTFTQIDLLAKVLDTAYKLNKGFTDISRKMLSLAKQLRTYGR